MKILINKVNIIGILKTINLKEGFSGKFSADYINGTMVVKTKDGSEHEVMLFSWKYKKNTDGTFSNNLNAKYLGYLTIINEYKDSDQFPDEFDYVSISASLGGNTYKSKKTGEVLSSVNITSNFINRITKFDYDDAPDSADFEIEGIIQSINDEIKNDELTGSKKVVLNAINQIINYSSTDLDNKAKPLKIFPIDLIVQLDMVELFSNVGYDEGCVTKLKGVMINKVEYIQKVEKQSFGEDIVKTFSNITRKKIIKSGGAPEMISDVGLTSDDLTQLKNKRSEEINAIKNGNIANQNTVISVAHEPIHNPFSS